MGLARELTLPLKPDNRASDLNGFDPGLGLHDRIGTPDLRARRRGAVLAAPGAPRRCRTRSWRSRIPAPGRLLLIADSFGDEIGGDFSEYAGEVWLVRMNLALVTPAPALTGAIRAFNADAAIVLYHDAGALALDPASQASLALAARLLADAGLPPTATCPVGSFLQ